MPRAAAAVTAAAAAALRAGAAPPRGSRTSAYVRRASPGRVLSVDEVARAHAAGRTDTVVDQVHVIGGGCCAATVVYATDDETPRSVVSYREKGRSQWRATADADATTTVHSSLNYYVGTKPDGQTPDFGNTSWGDPTNPQDFYTSPVLHHVHLSGLHPGTRYQYSIPPSADVFEFATLPAPAPDAAVTFAVIGDLGQTNDSVATLRHVAAQAAAGAADAIICPGDLSYADGYGLRWDSFGQLSEPVFASLPGNSVPGNHEFMDGETFAAYSARYPAPRRSVTPSSSPLWYSLEQGPAHVLYLCSYCVSSPGSLQYRWIERDLARAAEAAGRTPWIIAVFHSPWYNSNTYHNTDQNSVAMRRDVEPLFARYGVAVAISGHVHSYERTHPVAGLETVGCGTVHICVGDAGNREGLATNETGVNGGSPWFHGWVTPQPEWSAFREAAFGYGSLAIRNATHAQWSWLRNEDGRSATSDAVWIERARAGCVRTPRDD